MARAKFQTLTEQMFYILLCLKEECCGIDIMDKVSQMTDGRVKVGSGTLYNLLEQFLDSGIIIQTKADGRRRNYVLTDKGRIIEFQHSPISINDFQKRTHDYLLRSIFEETKRAIWVFDFSEREFTVGSKRYDWNKRARKMYWSRSKNLFGDYRNYNGQAQYELWMLISPYSSRLDKNVNIFLRNTKCDVFL